MRKLASDFLHDPVQVNIGNTDQLVANKDVKQIVHVVPSMHDKHRLLSDVLREQNCAGGARVIVFCSTKRMCDQLERQMHGGYDGVSAAAIHGDKDQHQRNMVLANFKNGRVPCLLATDVAARGLDVKEVMAVVNFDFPSNVEDYIHRIGRTGRAGNKGTAYTFMTDKDGKHATKLIKIMQEAGQQVSEQLQALANRAPQYSGSGKLIQ